VGSFARSLDKVLSLCRVATVGQPDWQSEPADPIVKYRVNYRGARDGSYGFIPAAKGSLPLGPPRPTFTL